MDNVLFNRASVFGWELRQGIDQFAHQTCAALNLSPITVQWSPSIPTACINGYGKIKVRAVNDDARIMNKTLVRYAGFIVHELLHRKYTDFRVNSGTPYVDKLHNAIEDAWIERRGIQSGLLGNIQGLLQGLMNGMLEECTVTDWADSSVYPFSLAVYAREFVKRVPVPANLLPVWEEATRRIDSAKSSHDTLRIAEWVYDQIKAKAQEESKEESPDKGDKNKGDEGQDSQDSQESSAQDSQESRDGNAQGEDGQASEQEGQDGQGEQDAGQDAGEDGQGGQDGQDSGQDGQQEGASDAPGASESDDQDEGKGEVAPKDAGRSQAPGDDAMDVEPTANAPDNAAQNSASGNWSTAEITHASNHLRNYPAEIKMNVPAKLRYEVRSLFDNSATTQFTINRKSGSINPGALHKFGQSERLFQQRKDEDGIDSAVVIVLDISGSMFMQGRMRSALTTCAAFIDALHSAQVQTAIVTFGSNVALSVPFGTVPSKAKSIISQVSSDSSTNDFAAIKYAHDLLRQRREARKICFVITDGCGHRDATKQQCKSGESFDITTIGVGIGIPVGDVYPHAVWVQNASDLAKVSFGAIKKFV